MFIRTIFITGTDTGVGKTLLTALLLSHLRQNGCQALAMKPFCSGSRADAELLFAIQDGDLTLVEINPFHFSEPLAPLVAARKHRRRIRMEAVLESIKKVQRTLRPATRDPRPVTLLIEGAGGLLAPLGKNYSAADLIVALRCSVIVAARNHLGTLNHTLLTARVLAGCALAQLSHVYRHLPPSSCRGRTILTGAANPKVVVMNQQQSDASTRSNPEVLSELLPGSRVFSIPFLGENAMRPAAIARSAKRLTRRLAEILGHQQC